ncbi:MAG: hypothetical protein WBG50_14090 [Desulfomonilaceae bacterium]
MKFALAWDRKAKEAYNALKLKAEASLRSRETSKRKKATKDEGLFKQVRKCIQLLQQNPRHPGLQTHEYESMANPFDKDQKVFEAYAQQHTSGAYRVFWCYGPQKGEITIIAIAPHP